MAQDSQNLELNTSEFDFQISIISAIIEIYVKVQSQAEFLQHSYRQQNSKPGIPMKTVILRVYVHDRGYTLSDFPYHNKTVSKLSRPVAGNELCYPGLQLVKTVEFTDSNYKGGLVAEIHTVLSLLLHDMSIFSDIEGYVVCREVLIFDQRILAVVLKKDVWEIQLYCSENFSVIRFVFKDQLLEPMMTCMHSWKKWEMAQQLKTCMRACNKKRISVFEVGF